MSWKLIKKCSMDSDNIDSINLKANQKFLDGEVIKSTKKSKSQNGDAGIVDSMVNGSYEFTWGHIIEQIAGNFFIWGVRISALANMPDGETRDLYQNIFRFLQERHPKHTSENAILVAGLHDWCIYPGHGEDAIIIAAPFQVEYKSRIWVHGSVLSEDIPEIISSVINRT